VKIREGSLIVAEEALQEFGEALWGMASVTTVTNGARIWRVIMLAGENRKPCADS
jgi:hypothetical protein